MENIDKFNGWESEENFIWFGLEKWIMYDKFEILKEIDEWEKEIAKLEDSDEDESEQIAEIQERIDTLNDALEDMR